MRDLGQLNVLPLFWGPAVALNYQPQGCLSVVCAVGNSALSFGVKTFFFYVRYFTPLSVVVHSSLHQILKKYYLLITFD